MEIYAEYLFAENFLAGIAILHLVGRLTGNRAAKGRLVEGGIFSGLYSFIIFCHDLGIMAAILCKIIFSVAIVLNTYSLLPPGQKNHYHLGASMKKLFRMVIMFYLVSFAMGGISIGVMYLAEIPGVTQNGTVYMGEITYVKVIVGFMIAYFVILMAADWLKYKGMKDSLYSDVVICMAGREWQLRALLDTGNMLKDPVSGNPVCVISRKAARDIVKEAGGERFCVIPYKSIGRQGLLKGIRTDRIVIQGKTIEKPILAIYEGEFERAEKEKFDLLMNRAVLEGGFDVNG